jgi:hypothetical protein
MKAINGVIRVCSYCGEQVSSGKYCQTCKTQKGRKQIFEANAAIFKENAKRGFKVPTELKNWQ